jgi:hypothetical protein
MSTLPETRPRSTPPIAIGGRISIPDGWAMAILFAFFVTGVYAARLRPFWFDELSTLFMVDTPTIREMFRAIPTDGNPPLTSSWLGCPFTFTSGSNSACVSLPCSPTCSPPSRSIGSCAVMRAGFMLYFR